MAAPKGRPKPKGSGIKKGTTRSETILKKKRVEWILSVLEPTFEEDVKDMRAAERAKMYLDCMEYVQPKLARTEVSAEVKAAVTIVASKEDVNL